MMSPDKGPKIAYEWQNTREYGGRRIQIRTGANSQLDVSLLIANHEDFYGDPKVDQIVSFEDTFEPLIGEYLGQFGEWKPERLPDQGIVVLEYYYSEAVTLVEEVDELAQKLIADRRLYDDTGLATEYNQLAKAGYELLNKHSGEFGISHSTPLSLERGGLVATRLGLGCGKDTVISDEIRVVTKRFHPKSNPSHLSVSVKWRDLDQINGSIDGAEVEVIDFVNPASGASTTAAILGASCYSAKPSLVKHRAISSTKQGILFNKRALGERGIESQFYTLGICGELNANYYLSEIGKAVADAGHILRHNLPSWYEQ